MTWWMIVLLVLAVLDFIGCILIGVDAGFDGELRLRLKIGFIRVNLLPPKPKKPKKRKKQPAARKPAKKATSVPKKPLLTGDPAQLRRLLELGVQTLGDVRQKICVERLELFLYFGGEDPAQGAIAYGRAWAVIGGLTPLLDSLFAIRRRQIEPRFVPGEAKMRFTGRIVVTMTIGRALGLGLRAGIGFLKILADNQKGEAKV